jgi:putative intracellular protease/amidase
MRMSIVLFDGFTALDIVGGYEVLVQLPDLEVEFVAAAHGAVASDTRRLGLVAYRTYDEALADGGPTLLYVPGGPGVVPASEDAELLDFIRAADATSDWTIGICNGVALLGAAGLLEGRTVTTNWSCRDEVAAFGAKVVPERYHRDGGLLTGAGVSASIDAALYLASLLAGDEMAQLIQLGIEYDPCPPFDSGSPEKTTAQQQALVRAFSEGVALQRLRDVAPPF